VGIVILYCFFNGLRLVDRRRAREEAPSSSSRLLSLNMAMALHVVFLIVIAVGAAAFSNMPCLQRRTVGNVAGMEMKRKGKKVCGLPLIPGRW
jgi:hypothetical protein